MSISEPIAGIYAFVEVNADGSEGIVGMGVMGGTLVLPMVTSSEGNVRNMVPVARQHARATGLRVELRYFEGPARVLETFHS